jgi:hypothetical protein
MTPICTRRSLLGLAAGAILADRIRHEASAQDDDVTRLLESAAARMASLVSFHFEMETIDGKSLIMESLELTAVAGDVVRPDSFQATIDARLIMVEVSVDVVSIGGKVWVTDPLQSGTVWQQIADGSESGGGAASFTDLINPDRLFLLAITYIQDPVIEGSEEINGEDCTIVTGTFKPSDLQEIASPIAEGTPANAESLLATDPVYLTAWIAGDGRVFQMEEAGPLTAAESRDVIRRVSFTNFDGDIQIVEPTVDQE